MSKARLVALACFLIVASANPGFSQSTRRSRSNNKATPPSAVSRYVEALKIKDFKTVVDLTHYYQQEVAAIRASNPRVLWSKLINEYYDQKISHLVQASSQWGDLARSTMAMEGDPVTNIRSILDLLPHSCTWKVSEIRSESYLSPIYGEHRRTSVHIVVDYPLDESTPIIDKNFLKQTMLNVSVHSRSQFVMNVFKLDGADVFWTKPYPKSAVVFLVSRYKGSILAGDKSAVDELTELVGWDVVERYLLDVLEQQSPRTPSFNVAVQFLAQRKVSGAIPRILVGLEGRNPALEGYTPYPDLNLVSALEQIGKSDNAQVSVVLRNRLSLLLSGMNRDYIDCINAHLKALTAVETEEAWVSFPYWYLKVNGRWTNMNGDTVFGSVLGRLTERKQRTAAIASSPSGPGNIGRFFRDLNACDGPSCPAIALRSQSIRVLEPMRVEIQGRILQGLYGRTTDVGSFKLVLKRTLDDSNPWSVQEIVRLL